MMSMGFPSEKPMPAAAQPEYEFSIEMTTGISAPPDGYDDEKAEHEGDSGHCRESCPVGGLAKKEPQAESDHQDCKDQVDHMLAAESDRCAAHAA